MKKNHGWRFCDEHSLGFGSWDLGVLIPSTTGSPFGCEYRLRYIWVLNWVIYPHREQVGVSSITPLIGGWNNHSYLFIMPLRGLNYKSISKANLFGVYIRPVWRTSHSRWIHVAQVSSTWLFAKRFWPLTLTMPRRPSPGQKRRRTISGRVGVDNLGADTWESSIFSPGSPWPCFLNSVALPSPKHPPDKKSSPSRSHRCVRYEFLGGGHEFHYFFVS